MFYITSDTDKWTNQEEISENSLIDLFVAYLPPDIHLTSPHYTDETGDTPQYFSSKMDYLYNELELLREGIVTQFLLTTGNKIVVLYRKD